MNSLPETECAHGSTHPRPALSAEPMKIKKHLFSCNHPDAIAGREKSFASLCTRISRLSPELGHVWIDLARTTITNLGGTFTSTFAFDDSLDDLRTSLTHIGNIHFFQGRLHKTIWTDLQQNRGAHTGSCIIEALVWRYSAMTWRKNASTNAKETLDLDISSLRTTLIDRHIPHTRVPHGLRFTLDSKLSWLRGERASLLLWTQGEHPSQTSLLSTHPKADSTAAPSHSTSTINLGNSVHPPTVRIPQ
jgi:hypothetical protein